MKHLPYAGMRVPGFLNPLDLTKLSGMVRCTTEDLGQTHTGTLIVGSTFVSPSEPWLVDSVDFLMVFLTPLGSYNLSSILQYSLWVSASAPISCWMKPL